MENTKLVAFENKINEFVGKELKFQNKLLNELDVDKVLILAEETALEWQSIIRSDHLDQTKSEIQKISSFFLQAFHLRNLYLNAKSYFLNVTLMHINTKEEDLGFKFLTDRELAEISEELLNPKQNIVEAISLLENEQIATSLCHHYNELNLNTKLISLGA